jgi:hypothetical protein
MLTLELDLGLNTNVGDHEIFALADQKWEFLLIWAESYEFSSNSAVLSSFHQIYAMSVRLHILLVDDVNKLVNM